MEWHECIERLVPHVFHLSTPTGSGTAWLVSASKTTKMVAVATAAHVVDHAHQWELPLRLSHPQSGKSVLLRVEDRAVLVDAQRDTAAIIFHRAPDVPVPEDTLPLIKQGYRVKPGVEIGWLGYPAIAEAGLCFFSGTISNYVGHADRYLVDGVVINGVSGGPACTVLDLDLS